MELRQQHPDWTMQNIYHQTCLSVSPFIDNIPTHSTGAAIDMSPFYTQGPSKGLLDMGQFDVIHGPNLHMETFSTNTTPEQRNNRLLLLRTAIQCGLANYGYEWWHFSYGDKMHTAVYGEKQAQYGLDSLSHIDPSIPQNDQTLLQTSLADYFQEITSKEKQNKR